MSKFDQLCEALRSSRKQYLSYEKESWGFAGKLIVHYKKYLEIPEEYFKVVPADKGPEEGSIYTIPGAMHLDEDTFWHFRILVTLEPSHIVSILFRIKKIEDGSFLVRISDIDKDFVIQVTDDIGFNPLFEFLQEKIRKELEDGLQNFLAQASPKKFIGFRP